AEGACHMCMPPDPGIQSAALGASKAAALGACTSPAPGAGEAAALGAGESTAPGAGESTLSGAAPAAVLHTFTLDSGASRSFFRDSTTLTPLSRPVAVSLADPSGDPVLAHSSTVLPCPATPSGLLSGLHLPSFSTNLVSGADLQDASVDQFTPGGQRVTHCTCSRTGRHLATFTRRPGSSLYTLTTAPPPVSASGRVAASSQVFAATSRSSPASAPCSSRPLAHETLLWHHCLRHPSLPHLRGMASRALVSRLPRQHAAPHSSSFPPNEAPLQTLHMDMWGPACVRGQGHERYFLLVVDDYSRYTTVFPLRSKGEVPEGIRQTFTLPASPQQNGIAERRIGMVMDIARTSMIHAAAPHFLWPFVVQYAAHQINLQPRVSLPETTPTLRWTGKVGDASAFRDVTFDESVSYYRLFPYRTASLPPPPLFLAPGTPPVDPLPPQGPAPSGVSQVDPAEPVEVAVDSGAARGAECAGAGMGDAETWGAESGDAESGDAESGRAEPGGVEPEGTVSRGAEPARAGSGGTLGVPSRREPLSPQRLREWYSRRCRVAAGAGGAASACAAGGAASAGGAAGASGGAAGAGAAGVSAGAGAAGGAAGAGAAGCAAGAGAAGGAAGTGDLRAGGTGSVSAISGGAMRPRPYYVPLFWQPASPLPGPSPYTGPTRVLTEGPCPSALSCSVLSSAGPDPASDSLRAACPAVTRFLATAVTDPLFESTAASALVAELVDFAAACRLEFATSLVSESAFASVCPKSVGGECSLGTDVLEDRQEDFECFVASVPRLVSMLIAPEGDPDAPDIPTPRSYAEAIEGPYSSQWQAAMHTEMDSWKSTRTYVDEVPPPGANIVSGMWIFRVKRPSGSPPVFKARYVARGFSQRQGVDFFQTFSPTPKMTTLQVLLHVAAHRDYELHSLDFSTAFLQGSLHKEIWLRRPPGFTGSFPAGTQWSLRRPVYGLRQAPREWQDKLRTTLAALGFAPSTSDPSLFLRTNTALSPFYVLVYLDDLVFATTDTEALAHEKSELQKRHTCTDLGEVTSYLGLRITRDRAQRTITLTRSHMVHQVLQRFGFTYSSPQSTPLPTDHSLSAPPSDESVEPNGPSLPPLPPSPAPPCLPCVEGRQRAAPHSSSFPPMTAPLQTLHMDVWGPARVSGQGRKRFFLLVVYDYTPYTTVFPLRSKGEFCAVLIPWIRTVRLQLRERYSQDLPVLRLHSDRGVMEVARTSMIHAAAPHFLWPFAVRYAAHQLNLWPCVSLTETSPTLRWTRKVGDESVFRVWGSRAFVRDTSADKLSARAIPCVFLGLVPDAPGWHFYHPTSRRVLPSQDVTFDELVPFYCLFPYRSAPSPPPPLFLAPGPPPVDPHPPHGPAPSGVSQVDPLPGTALVQGSGSGDAEPEGVEPGGAESEGAEPGGAESEGAESGGAEPRGAASSGGAAVSTGAGDPTKLGAAGAGGAGAGVAGAGGPGVLKALCGHSRTSFPCFSRFLVSRLLLVFLLPFLCPTPDQLQPASPLPVPSPYTEQSGGLTERREPASRPVSPVRIALLTPCSRPPPVPGTHTMALRPSSVPLRVPMPTPPESSLLEVPDPKTDRAHAASPTVARLLAIAAASALVAELLDFATT
ncbi:unnamed protein product, partial [Closterium sp. NIES-54]